jgi:hypothetical protein
MYVRLAIDERIRNRRLYVDDFREPRLVSSLSFLIVKGLLLTML